MTRFVKRYANRKLYDVRASRYVSLDDLADVIRGGEAIAVTDAATGGDLTSVTLAQIILERERASHGALPAELLHQLVRHGTAWQEFVHASLCASLAGVLDSPEETARLDRLVRAWSARAGLAPATDGDRARPPDPAAEPDSRHGELERLGQQLTALEQRLQAMEHRLQPPP